MAIGIVDDSDFEEELSKSGSSTLSLPEIEVKTEIINSPERGRKKGDVDVPESLRKIIGETSVIDGRQEALNLAKDFNISPSSVSAYSNSATSTTTYHESNKNLREHINKAKERVSRKARNRLHWALDNITDEKLKEADLKTVSFVAKNMSGIIRDMDNSIPPDASRINSPQFIVFAPQFNREDKYETIVVKE